MHIASESNNSVIEHEEKNMREKTFMPIELEAIAKLSRLVDELNRVLTDEGSLVILDWSADNQNEIVAGRGEPGSVSFGH